MVWPATVTVPLSGAPAELSATLIVTDPLPLPLVGVTVMKGALDVAVHGQETPLALMLREALPPVVEKAIAAGETMKEQPVPVVSVRFTVCPATVRVPERVPVVVLVEALTCTAPFPVPLAGLTVAHVALETAVQGQVWKFVEMVTCAGPPDPLNARERGVTV